VESARFRGLVLDTACWIEAGDWTRNPDDLTRMLREQPIVGATADELRRRWKKLLKAGAQLRELDPERRHRTRLQAKKLRYASEFFAGAFPGKKAARRRNRFVAGLEKLQDALGELNDIAVHAGLTERLVDGSDARDKQREGLAKEAFAAGRLSGDEEARITSVLQDAERAYRGFTKAKPFWSCFGCPGKSERKLSSRHIRFLRIRALRRSIATTLTTTMMICAAVSPY